MRSGAPVLALDRDDHDAVLAIDEQLRDLSRVSANDAGVAPQWLGEALTDLLGLDIFCAHRPTKQRDGAWRPLESVFVGPDGFLDRYVAIMDRVPAPFHYNPLKPEPSQRNTVRLRRHLCAHGPDEQCIAETLWPEIGIGSHDQIRLLVCERSTLVAWFGGFRLEPFGKRDERIMQALAGPLRRALWLRRKLLDVGIAGAGVEGAVGLLAAPVFFADGRGNVQYANAVGSELLNKAAARTKARIVDAIRGRNAGDCEVARVTSAGRKPAFLVILRDPAREFERRLELIAQLWGATPRELDVLRGVVVGDSNKEIALRLKCHEGNVERHVTALLQKARCDGRSRLVARFWTAA